jgi:UDP-N-acetylmuramate dehydrogenase
MEILYHEPLKNHTTFRVGGECDRFITASREEGIKILMECRERKEPILLLGRGSNVLVSDRGFAGTVLNFEPEEPELLGDDVIRVSAGTALSYAASFAAERGLSGLECLHGIPGTLGGASVMNAGAYGRELKDCFLRGEVLTEEGEVKTVSLQDMAFGYRSSAVEPNRWVLLSAELQLEKADKEAIRAKMQELNAKRREKQPLELPSAGSTFRRPEGYFAGKLIEDAGMKGACYGGAAVSEKHAGFIVNKDNATAADIYILIRKVQKAVFENSGVQLQCEVKMVGDFSECNL